MARIEPVAEPYDPEVGERLASMMPPGVPPIGLFRTFVRNRPMTDAMHGWGRYELGRELSLTMRDRELLIDRTCVRCGCEYEWGVHTAFFAERVGLTSDQVSSLVYGSPADACWPDERDRVLIEVADALHDHATLDDALWERATRVLDDAQILDACLLCGWYHAISYVARTAEVDLEDGAPRFADVQAGRAAEKPRS